MKHFLRRLRRRIFFGDNAIDVWWLYLKHDIEESTPPIKLFKRNEISK